MTGPLSLRQLGHMEVQARSPSRVKEPLQSSHTAADAATVIVASVLLLKCEITGCSTERVGGERGRGALCINLMAGEVCS